MSFSKTYVPWTAVAFVALTFGCGDELGRFLEYDGLRFLSDNGKVQGFSGSHLHVKPLPSVRLKGKLDCVLQLQVVTEEELVSLGADGRQCGFDKTVYEFEQGEIYFQKGKLDSFSFRGLPAPGVVSIATTKDGPFVSLPAPEKEIRKLFGVPSRVTRGSRPFH